MFWAACKVCWFCPYWLEIVTVTAVPSGAWSTTSLPLAAAARALRPGWRKMVSWKRTWSGTAAPLMRR